MSRPPTSHGWRADANLGIDGIYTTIPPLETVEPHDVRPYEKRAAPSDAQEAPDPDGWQGACAP